MTAVASQVTTHPYPRRTTPERDAPEDHRWPLVVHLMDIGPASSDLTPATEDDSEGLVRLIVDLTPSAFRALNSAVCDGGDTPTDTANRALLFYAKVQRMAERRGGRFTFRTQYGHLKQVRVTNG